MFTQTVHVQKPLNLTVRVRRLGGDVYPVIDDGQSFTMIFDDIETLNDFAQAVHGLAQSVKIEEEIYQEENAPTGA